MPSEKHNRIIRPGDILFALVLFGAAAVCAAFLWLQPPGATVIFRLDGREVARRPLLSSGTVTVEGEYVNVFEIQNGSVRIAETTCPNHACKAAGAISRRGSSILCAPNHVSAVIEGGTLDAFTG